MGLNIILVLPLHFYLGIGHVGLALATTLAAILNSFLLFKGLRKNDIYKPEEGWRKFLVILLNANIAMCICLYVLISYSNSWFDMAWWERASSLGTICITGAVVYIFMLFVSGFRVSHLKNK
jgi:putative peptidoglycan lipid II flippase